MIERTKTRKLLLCWLRRLSRGVFRPRYFVRICRNRTELISIVNEATAEEHHDENLVERVIQFVLGDGDQELSVFETQTDDPLDVGHALAIIAETIDTKTFRRERQDQGKKRKRGATRGSLFIPLDILPASITHKYTPWNNLNFYPANDRHYDLRVTDSKELARAILSGLSSGTIGWTYLENKDCTYQSQVIVAFIHCRQRFGKLNADSPPANWDDGTHLTAGEQIETLRFLSRADEMYRPQ